MCVCGVRVRVGACVCVRGLRSQKMKEERAGEEGIKRGEERGREVEQGRGRDELRVRNGEGVGGVGGGVFGRRVGRREGGRDGVGGGM